MNASYVVCVSNEGYPASLEPRKLYQLQPDDGLPEDHLRVVDESGEDYVYPARLFMPVKLSVAARTRL